MYTHRNKYEPKKKNGMKRNTAIEKFFLKRNDQMLSQQDNANVQIAKTAKK